MRSFLHPVAAGTVGRAAVRSHAVLRGGAAAGQCVWFDRLVSSIIGVHNWHLALFDQEAQAEVWGDDPKTRVSSSYAPMGAGVVTDGGYLVNGSWNWSSGCDHATWASSAAPSSRTAGQSTSAAS